MNALAKSRKLSNFCSALHAVAGWTTSQSKSKLVVYHHPRHFLTQNRRSPQQKMSNLNLNWIKKLRGLTRQLYVNSASNHASTWCRKQSCVSRPISRTNQLNNSFAADLITNLLQLTRARPRYAAILYRIAARALKTYCLVSVRGMRSSTSSKQPYNPLLLLKRGVRPQTLRS